MQQLPSFLHSHLQILWQGLLPSPRLIPHQNLQQSYPNSPLMNPRHLRQTLRQTPRMPPPPAYPQMVVQQPLPPAQHSHATVYQLTLPRLP